MCLAEELILSTLEKLENGTLERTPQPEDEATYTKKITKVMGDIDWTEDAAVIERYIRGLNPWPSAYTSWNGKTLKIWDADVLEQEYSGEPGEIIKVEKDGVLVKTGKDTLVLREVQLEGKKRMEIQAFLRGYQLSHGTILKRSES